MLQSNVPLFIDSCIKDNHLFKEGEIVLPLTSYKRLRETRNVELKLPLQSSCQRGIHSDCKRILSIRNLPLSIKTHQFLCGCPNKGGPPGTAGSAVLAREKTSINSGLKGSNTTTPT